MIAWIAFLFSMVGIVLNAKKIIWCWPVWLVSNVLWIIHMTQTHDNAALMTWVVFLAFNVYGYYEWYTNAHGGLKPFKRNKLFNRVVRIGNEKWIVTNEATPDGYEVKLKWKHRFLPSKVIDSFTSLNYERAKKMESVFTNRITKEQKEHK